MSTQEESHRIGLIVGNETDLPTALIREINEKGAGISAELVKLGATFVDERPNYSLIIDRMSHEIPYYRTYLKHAATQGTMIIDNPFSWAADDRYYSMAMVRMLGLHGPRTLALPNKHAKLNFGPNSFRNLKYPMDWQGIIDYVGVPAILKDIDSGGRIPSQRVHSLDELIQRYDESDTRSMILQQLIESDQHIHCFVVGQEKVLTLNYAKSEDRYLANIETGGELIDRVRREALALTSAYGYDINMVEFVIDGSQPYITNGSNPCPIIDLELMSEDQFAWCVKQIAKVAIDRCKNPVSQHTPFNFQRP